MRRGVLAADVRAGTHTVTSIAGDDPSPFQWYTPYYTVWPSDRPVTVNPGGRTALGTVDLEVRG